MKAQDFIGKIRGMGIDTFIGVPDSALKGLCDYLNFSGERGVEHYVPANEGAAVAMAAGTYLATGRPACVYMQNSGIGNAINPIASLLHREVYNIPALFLAGWRGEPGVKDEPQHLFQGKITEGLFHSMGMETAIIGPDTDQWEVERIFSRAALVLAEHGQYAIIIRKNTFENEAHVHENSYGIVREEAIGAVMEHISEQDIVVATTGKISRELYEFCKREGRDIGQTFLTVGSMGHASMIALAIALKRKDKCIYCMDGDGALLMHMGALPFIASQNPVNYTHILFNNDAHESVGGMPTGAVGTDYHTVAQACGYPASYQIRRKEELESVFVKIKKGNALSFVEIKVALGSRNDLGRPKENPLENRDKFMRYHEGIEE